MVFSSKFIMDLANSIIFWALKFICNFWIIEICQISDARSNLKFQLKTSFKFHCSYSYIAVKLQLYIAKMSSLKRFKEVLTLRKCIAFWRIYNNHWDGIRNRTIKGSHNIDVSRNAISTWLLPWNKEKIKSTFQSGEVSNKKTWGSDKMRIWRQCWQYLASLKECEWTNYQLAEQFQKKKQSAMYSYESWGVPCFKWVVWKMEGYI